MHCGTGRMATKSYWVHHKNQGRLDKKQLTNKGHLFFGKAFCFILKYPRWQLNHFEVLGISSVSASKLKRKNSYHWENKPQHVKVKGDMAHVVHSKLGAA